MAPALMGMVSQVAQGGGQSPSLLNIAPEMMKVISSWKQLKQAKQLERQYKRPQYNIPGQISEATNMARMDALDTNLPGQRQAEERISGSASQAINQSINSGAGSNTLLAAISGVNRNQQNALNDLSIQGAQQQIADRAALRGQLGIEAQYADKAWEWNKQKPYLDAMNSAAALRNASSQNLFSALTNIPGILKPKGGGQGMPNTNSGSGFGSGASGVLGGSSGFSGGGGFSGGASDSFKSYLGTPLNDPMYNFSNGTPV